MSKLLLIIVTGGFALLGIILFTSSQNIQENYLPAVIEQAQQIQETPTPALVPTPTPSLSPLPTTTPAPTFTPVPSLIPETDHIFYTSSHWKTKYYYCDTDGGWKNLSKKYLQTFNSEQELLQNYDRILHEPCNN